MTLPELSLCISLVTLALSLYVFIDVRRQK